MKRSHKTLVTIINITLLVLCVLFIFFVIEFAGRIPMPITFAITTPNENSDWNMNHSSNIENVKANVTSTHVQVYDKDRKDNNLLINIIFDVSVVIIIISLAIIIAVYRYHVHKLKLKHLN